jgi:hypothetical protein
MALCVISVHIDSNLLRTVPVAYSLDVGISQPSKKSRTERGGRKGLDILFEESAISLCKGYSLEQLRDLHEKIAVLSSEVVHQLDYDFEVQEIVGTQDGSMLQHRMGDLLYLLKFYFLFVYFFC